VSSDIVTVRTVAHPSRAQPLRDAAVMRAEAPVLVHHQPAAGALARSGARGRFARTRFGAQGADVGHERLGFGKRRRQRLLTEDREALPGGQPADWRVRLARRGDVDRVQALGVEHRFDGLVRGRDPERRYA
jgi:hypothetical protein